MSATTLETVMATRYVAPLREGGSMPGLVEADDLGTYVMKFRGAGQGTNALVAEVIVGELARSLGFRVPELRTITLDEAIARYEPDEEVQDLLSASIGRNLAVDFLPGAFGYDGGRGFTPDPHEAARVLWLDAFSTNIDRTWRNPNLLIWHRDLWVFDHGAALYFHHAWGRPDAAAFAAKPFDAGAHVFAAYADRLADADDDLAARITPERVTAAVALVPDEWLAVDPDTDASGRGDADTVRRAYVEHLLARVAAPRTWLADAARTAKNQP